jgi:hypothetical protein
MRFPAATEAGEHLDQHSVQMFVEGARGGERFHQGEGGLMIALLG